MRYHGLGGGNELSHQVESCVEHLNRSGEEALQLVEDDDLAESQLPPDYLDFSDEEVMNHRQDVNEVLKRRIEGIGTKEQNLLPLHIVNDLPYASWPGPVQNWSEIVLIKGSKI